MTTRTRRMRVGVALAALLLAAACRLDGFRPTEQVPEATGPIPAGLGRIRIENGTMLETSEIWFTPCIGGAPLKVNRRVAPGGSTQQDVEPGCVRVTIYWRGGGALFVNVTVVANQVTTQPLS